MDSRFSIVMQGGILDKYGNLDAAIVENIKRVRCNFISSEFILSTWEVCEEIQCELEKLAEELSLIVLYSKDPGSIYSSDKLVSSNINRMIVSTRNGIKISRREFIIKIRTDSYLYDKKIVSNLLHIVGSKIEKNRDAEYSIFEHYVINCSLFARDSRGYLPYLFHPGDICLAGAKEDMLLIFDIPLADESIFSDISRACFLSFMKYVPEQYIWVYCIRNKTGRLIYSGNDVYDKQSIELSERFYINNFIVLSPMQLGFKWPKYEITYRSKGLYSIYSLNDWKALYNKYNKRYFEIDKKLIIIKKIITFMSFFYFFARTCALRISFLRKLAVKFFRKRG